MMKFLTFLFIFGLSSAQEGSLQCGIGTYDDGTGFCVVDNRDTDPPSIESRNGVISLSVNGARLSLDREPTQATDAHGNVFCQGAHVYVDENRQCSPRIDILDVGDTQVRLSEIVTYADLEPLARVDAIEDLTNGKADRATTYTRDELYTRDEVDGIVSQLESGLNSLNDDIADVLLELSQKADADTTYTTTEIDAIVEEMSVSIDESIAAAEAAAEPDYYYDEKHGLIPRGVSCPELNGRGYTSSMYYYLADEDDESNSRTVRCNMDVNPPVEVEALTSCKAHLEDGERTDGAYNVVLDDDEEEAHSIWCNQEEHGGGWELIYAINSRFSSRNEWYMNWEQVTREGKNFDGEAEDPANENYLMPVKYWTRYNTIMLRSDRSGVNFFRNFRIEPNNEYRWFYNSDNRNSNGHNNDYHSGKPLQTSDRRNGADDGCVNYGRSFGWYHSCCNVCMTTGQGGWGSGPAYQASDWSYRHAQWVYWYGRRD